MSIKEREEKVFNLPIYYKKGREKIDSPYLPKEGKSRHAVCMSIIGREMKACCLFINKKKGREGMQSGHCEKIFA